MFSDPVSPQFLTVDNFNNPNQKDFFIYPSPDLSVLETASSPQDDNCSDKGTSSTSLTSYQMKTTDTNTASSSQSNSMSLAPPTKSISSSTSPKPSKTSSKSKPSNRKRSSTNGSSSDGTDEGGKEENTTDYGYNYKITTSAVNALGPDGVALANEFGLVPVEGNSSQFRPAFDKIVSGRRNKDPKEMDKDERLLASEEAKKLTSQQRRQLRNRVSARHFRLRRKEYISHLETLVSSMTGKIAKMEKEIKEAKKNQELLTLIISQNPHIARQLLVQQLPDASSFHTSNAESASNVATEAQIPVLEASSTSTTTSPPIPTPSATLNGNFDFLSSQPTKGISTSMTDNTYQLNFTADVLNEQTNANAQFNRTAPFNLNLNTSVNSNIGMEWNKQNNHHITDQQLQTQSQQSQTQQHAMIDSIRMKPSIVNLLPTYAQVPQTSYPNQIKLPSYSNEKPVVPQSTMFDSSVLNFGWNEKSDFNLMTTQPSISAIAITSDESNAMESIANNQFTSSDQRFTDNSSDQQYDANSSGYMRINQHIYPSAIPDLEKQLEKLNHSDILGSDDELHNDKEVSTENTTKKPKADEDDKDILKDESTDKTKDSENNKSSINSESNPDELTQHTDTIKKASISTESTTTNISTHHSSNSKGKGTARSMTGSNHRDTNPIFESEATYKKLSMVTAETIFRRLDMQMANIRI